MPLNKKEAMRLMGSYVEEHSRCAVCHWPKYAVPRRMEVHHIYGRFGGDRAHDHRNLLLLCRDCHFFHHAGGSRNLTMGQILTAKREEDGNVDLAFLASLKNRRALLADLEPLPGWALKEREENCGH
jgi:hypothetical protein